MDRASAANVAKQARSSTAANKRGRKERKRQLICPHTETRVEASPQFNHTLCANCGMHLDAEPRC